MQGQCPRNNTVSFKGVCFFLNLKKFKHNLIVAVGCLSKPVLKSTQRCTLEVVCSFTVVKYTEHVYCINNLTVNNPRVSSVFLM